MELGSRYGNVIQLKCLLESIRYEKQKAKKFVHLNSVTTKLNDSFDYYNAYDGTLEVLSETSDPLDETTRLGYIFMKKKSLFSIVPEWTVNMVAQWLCQHYFEHLVDRFTNNSINGACLLSLSIFFLLLKLCFFLAQKTMKEDLGLFDIQAQSVNFYLQQLIQATNNEQPVFLDYSSISML